MSNHMLPLHDGSVCFADRMRPFESESIESTQTATSEFTDVTPIPSRKPFNRTLTVSISDSDQKQESASLFGSPIPETFLHSWKQRGQTSKASLAVISALYANILVIMGLAFPMTEVLSKSVTSSSYLAFYLYLYFGSILYFIYVFITLIRIKTAKFCDCCWRSDSYEDEPSSHHCNDDTLRSKNFNESSQQVHHGSFYLRIGAVVFGVGSMIFSGLEFAQYFEVDISSHCRDIMLAITPAARMVFTFIQMYFIFLNSKMSIWKHKAIAYFGLMHMIATNLCVWLYVIVEETKHEIIHFLLFHKPNSASQLDNKLEGISSPVDSHWNVSKLLMDGDDVMDVLETMHNECKRLEVMGNLVQDASPFLFPCAIEYSLICAAILYLMWKKTVTAEVNFKRHESASSVSASRRSRHHYTVDCGKANKGLFAGIFTLVLIIISLILFFALINHPAYEVIAITEISVARVILFSTSFVAVLMGIFQVREMRFEARVFEVDDVLLIFGQIGLLSYNVFTVIAACHEMAENKDSVLVLITALAVILQAVTQTLFILDASRRTTNSADQQRRKPGREVVTFLLVANFAMWTVSTLDKSRADVNPVQLQFYGLWSWIIITNVSMPLAIFYRFHSTVVLCEIWKRCYKAKPDNS